MKYILFESPKSGDFPIVFPIHIEHDFIARCIRAEFPGIKPVSAGFCDNNGDVWGESISLKLKTNPEFDQYYLKKMLTNP